MPDGGDDNIFDVAGAQRPKKRPAPTEETAVLPAVPDSYPSGDEELFKRFDSVRGLRDDLERSLDEVYGNTGLNKDAVERFLDNPSNFKDLDFDGTQRQRDIMQREVEKMAGKDAVDKRAEKLKKKAMKKRRSKSRGLRRNWIDMR